MAMKQSPHAALRAEGAPQPAHSGGETLSTAPWGGLSGRAQPRPVREPTAVSQGVPHRDQTLFCLRALRYMHTDTHTATLTDVLTRACTHTHTEHLSFLTTQKPSTGTGSREAGEGWGSPRGRGTESALPSARPVTARLRQLVAQLGLSENCTFPGGPWHFTHILTAPPPP